MHRSRAFPSFVALLSLIALTGCGESDIPAEARPSGAKQPVVPGWPEPSAAQTAEAARLGVPVKREEPKTGLRFLLVPGGTFLMGSAAQEEGRDDDEGPRHEVTLAPFYLAMFETTNEQYRKFRPEHASGPGFDAPTQPAVRVSHADARAFVAWLSRQEQGGGDEARPVYALPTEAQWEYACRAGTTTAFAFGDTLSEDEANFSGQEGATTIVGQYPANAWGLHDMHGNAWEWCRDHYAADAYARPKQAPHAAVEPPTREAGRVARGGGWGFPADGVRSAYRRRVPESFRGKAIGFRVVRTVEQD